MDDPDDGPVLGCDFTHGVQDLDRMAEGGGGLVEQDDGGLNRPGPGHGPSRPPAAYALPVQALPSASETRARASSWTWARCSGPWKLSAYTL